MFHKDVLQDISVKRETFVLENLFKINRNVSRETLYLTVEALAQ